jgi:hypothetical protein
MVQKRVMSTSIIQDGVANAAARSIMNPITMEEEQYSNQFKILFQSLDHKEHKQAGYYQ